MNTSINMLNGLWKKKSGYLFNHKALAKVFRAKILEALVDQGLKLPEDCPKKWVVDCKNVGNGDKAIIYLGWTLRIYTYLLALTTSCQLTFRQYLF